LGPSGAPETTTDLALHFRPGGPEEPKRGQKGPKRAQKGPFLAGFRARRARKPGKLALQQGRAGTARKGPQKGPKMGPFLGPFWWPPEAATKREGENEGARPGPVWGPKWARKEALSGPPKWGPFGAPFWGPGGTPHPALQNGAEGPNPPKQAQNRPKKRPKKGEFRRN